MITRKVAAILSLSALSKNLENFPGTAELYPCDNVDKEYEECKSTTLTSYDAKHCEKIRKTKASCLERFMKDDLDQEDFCDDGGGIQSIHGEDIDEGYFGGCQALAKFGDCGESDDFLDESLDGDDHNKNSISALQESNFDTSAQRWEQHLKEYKESLQKKATAAGFDRPIDYLWHEREKDPLYCRISYEIYKKCLSENEKETCEYMRNNCPQFK
ncbi:unnamed protein product [Camellia sinensis]